ncbi:cell division protein SepF [Calidifontibacter sp. DB0510]|uniref:Cell division protein SepF n=1 Tax=Metallococcus carri TaxID=1656884 RepID=A0A967EAL9_9MICO|nr:cell division protein SepF [Metallococcus carri]NHN56029.1 cell division protein SepF [Metallococcus carri]NOP37514.1 cell division protein SepF [Calidifontibacter sp. DB2511S]
MAGALRKTMAYLGLAEEDRRYDDQYDEHHDYEAYDDYEDSGFLQEEDERDAAPAPVTQLHKSSPVRAVSSKGHDMQRINAIHPRTYNEAKEIGESFRQGIPVIMNLSDMEDSDAKRLVDFAAGLVFGLHGTIERVTAKVFLLSPSGVEVSTSGADNAGGARGPFNQS